jgi:CheY-like chemotaxis protein
MVVDPDPLTLTAISAMLDCAQFQVYCAQDRAAAMRGAEMLDLDLIVCDEEIDAAHGSTIMSALREIPSGADIPVVYLSRRQLPDVISRPHDGGAAYHLKKPVDPAGLLERINQALYELPLINHQVRQKVRAPHFPVTAIATIPNVPLYVTE